jgi:mannose-6-phosphate isomerase-like protein (cupin superfamily)
MKNFLNLLQEEFDKESTTGFHVNIEKETKKNNNFRKVLFTSDKIQLVVMSLGPGVEIGLETHKNTDQFIRVDLGEGEAIIGDKKYILLDGDAIIIPAGSKHNIIAGSEGMKLYTVYSPPHHEDGEIQKTKNEDHK